MIKETEEVNIEGKNDKTIKFRLRNGVHSGIQAMIMSVCQPGEKILMPRDIGSSATSRLILSGAKAIYLTPVNDNELGVCSTITLDQIKEQVEIEGGIKAIYLVNSREGCFASNLKVIVDYCNKRGIAVLIDDSQGVSVLEPEGALGAVEKRDVDLRMVKMLEEADSGKYSFHLILKDKLIEASTVKQAIALLEGPEVLNENPSDKEVSTKKTLMITGLPAFGDCILSPREAFYSKKEMVTLEESVGRIAGESIEIIPNEISLLIGEVISSDMIDYINEVKKNKQIFSDAHDESLERIKVVTTKKYIKNIR